MLPVRGVYQHRKLIWSPNGRYLATGGYTRMTVWNTATARPVFTVDGYDAAPLAWSPDSRYLEIDRGASRIWDVRTGAPAVEPYSFAPAKPEAPATLDPGTPGDAPPDLPTAREAIRSPNGRWIASKVSGPAVAIHNARTGARERLLSGSPMENTHLAWSPDSRLLAMNDPKKRDTLVLYDAPKRKILPGVVRFEDGFGSLAWHPKGRYLAVAGWAESVALVDAYRRRVIRRLEPAGDPISARWSPDGQTLATWAYDVPVTDRLPIGPHHELRNAATGKVGLRREGRAPTWSPNRRWYATMNRASVDVWQTTGPRAAVAHLPVHQYVWDIRWSPNSRYLGAPSGYGAADVFVWDTRQWKEKVRIEDVFGLSWSPDSRKIAAWYYDYDVHTIVWDLAAGKRLAGFRGAPAIWTGAGDILATAEGSILAFWNVNTQKQVGGLTVTEGTPRVPVAVSPGRKRIATAGNAIAIWDARKQKLLAELSGYGAKEIAWRPDGKEVAIRATRWRPDGRSYEDLTLICNGQTLKPRLTIPDSDEFVAWSPDGKTLATGAADGAMTLWDTATGKKRVTWYSLRRGKEWLIVTPEGYYDSSPKGADLVQWRKGSKLWPVSRDAKRFHRPDKMRAALAGK